MHRTGAKEWGDRLNNLIDKQSINIKVLGVTATPRRDIDSINMANEMAERLGYTNKEAVNGKHVAMNLSLINAIRMGLVVNPKLVSCAYSLKNDGSLDKLKGQIEQIESIEEKNEKLAQYETLRRNVENAEGIPEILQANVKKGGKYIVFLPITDELEDEDGNAIGRKSGKDKIKEYEKQIAEYFKGSEITPNFHSMLGKYGDKENARQLEEFQNTKTEDTEFMLVMNKANEGLHLDKLNGIIWLRPLDENSRILYLQQLGRVIYSEDPDNPTKDEDRPVVIDLVNNTIKVNWKDEITEQDDIQMLNLITNWAEAHNGILPNINSTDKEETGYARILKEIQDKYKGYLENEFGGLNTKQIEEVKEIVNLGSQIDLWQIELPKLEIINNSGKEKSSFADKKAGLFEVTGLLQDFVEFEDEVNEIEKVTAVKKFISTLKQMKSIGIDISKLKTKDTIETLAKKSGICKAKIVEIGLEPTNRIGAQKGRIAGAYRGTITDGSKPPTEKEVEELKELGISLELEGKEDAAQKLIDILVQLKSIGVDVSKLKTTDTIKSLAKKSGVCNSKIVEVGLDLTMQIGSHKKRVSRAYRGTTTDGSKPPTDKQVEELKKLGISLELKEKGNTIQKFIDTLTQMRLIGIDVSKLTGLDTIETLAKKSGINKTQIVEAGLEPTKKIGMQKVCISGAYRGRGGMKPPTDNQVKELKELGISLELEEKENATQKFIDILTQMQLIGIDVSKLKSIDTIESLAKTSDISKAKIEEIGLDPTLKIGRQKVRISMAYREKNSMKKPTHKQVEDLKKLGISLELEEKENATQKFIDVLTQMQSIGIDVSKLRATDTIETLAKKSGISKAKIEEIGLDPTLKIGGQRRNIFSAYRGKGSMNPPTDKQLKELKKLGISLELKKRTSKEIVEASISSLTDIEMSDREDAALKELIEKTKEGEVNLDEQS